jgi:hypothetical protein
MRSSLGLGKVPGTVEPVGDADDHDSVGRDDSRVGVSTRSGVGMSISIHDSEEEVETPRSERPDRGGPVAGAAGVGMTVPEFMGRLPGYSGMVQQVGGGTTFFVYHDDAVSFERHLSDPARSVVFLRQHQAYLHGAMQREGQQLLALQEVTSRRREMWEELHSRYDEEIRRLGGLASRRGVGVGNSGIGSEVGGEEVRRAGGSRDFDVGMMEMEEEGGGLFEGEEGDE